MAINNEQKMAIAARFVTAPKPYINREILVDAHLCEFNGGSFNFKFSTHRGSVPGLGVYIKNGMRRRWEEEFARLDLPNGYRLNDRQPHSSNDNGNGWIAFYKDSCRTLDLVYADIVSPGNCVEEWRGLFNFLKSKIEERFGNVETCGAIQNENNLPDTIAVLDQVDQNAENFDINEDDEMQYKYSKNLIVFGAPGTGKSYKLNEEVCQYFVEGEGTSRQKRFERVTFYPTYSYAQFVGTYKPVMRAKPNGADREEKIAYEFVPGPFLRVLVKALNETPDADGKKKDWCLVVEEINRANAAAVFGDVFQLLDRDTNGVSEYAIAASEDVKKYLGKELTEAGKNALNELTGSIESLRIPANMYIWATMNSADQGVFPMDTAFKRRWEFDNIGIDDEANGECSNWTIEGKGYNWNEIRRYINGLLAEHDVNEDKFMGPYFIKANSNNVVPKKMFASKVLMYLWEDAGRMIRRNLFGNNIKTYSKLVENWEREDVGVKVFDQCNKKENLAIDLRNLYANWTMPPPAEQNS